MTRHLEVIPESAPSCRLDHLTVVAPSLASGAERVRVLLGVAPQAGGSHPLMGTHNQLLRLGDEVFLEVIAVDPAAVPPDRPRWFALDHLPVDADPVLGAWVARCTNIQACLQAATEDLGRPASLTRGSLRWQFSLLPDGLPRMGGTAPALIEWQHGGPHPASGLPDVGCSLAMLVLEHPAPQRLQALIDSLGRAPDDVPVQVVAADAAALVAHIDTPHGRRVLRGRHPALAGR